VESFLHLGGPRLRVRFDGLFLEGLNDTKVHQGQEDRMIWILSKTWGFKVSTYYKVLRTAGDLDFAWRPI
jgi:hypothetical protein